jgi:hypothetical protein
MEGWKNIAIQTKDYADSATNGLIAITQLSKHSLA